MWKNVLLWAVLSLGLMWWCESTTDQKQVSLILQNTAQWSKKADVEFQSSLSAIDSLRSGRPMYQVSDLLRQHYEQLDRSTNQIARPYEVEAKRIENAKVRELMREGINSIHLVYNHKRTFVREVQDALNSNDTKRLMAAIKKYKDNDMETAGMVMGVGFFIEAKKALGMPPTVDEFKQ